MSCAAWAAPKAAARAVAEPPPETAAVPSGTFLSVELVDKVSSSKDRPGDEFRGRLLDGVYVKGRVALPPGTAVRGVVTQSVPSGRLTGQAKLQLTLASFQVEGSTYGVQTDTLSYLGDPHAGKNIGSLLGGALQGAIMGMLFGGAKGAIIGAGAGAGAGTVGNVIQGKQDVTFDQGARLLFETKEPVTVPVYAAPPAPEKPAEKPAERPAEKPAEKPAGKPTS